MTAKKCLRNSITISVVSALLIYRSMDQPLNTSQLASLRTRLAFDRTKNASERTLMAWIRTSLSMISFGFSIETFFRAYTKVQAGLEAQILVEPTILGLVLVGLGTFILILGAIDHYLYIHNANKNIYFFGKVTPWNHMFFTAITVIFIGIVIFIYMLLHSI